jgi:hypothetical protein
VLAYKGKAKIAIEIQWSPQTNEESLYRHERYRRSGVRCLWLFRRSSFPVSRDFPAACISGDVATGFKTHLGEQKMPLDEFLDAVFVKRFRYETPVGAKAIVRIHSWLNLQGEVTRNMRFIGVCVGPHRIQFTVPALVNFPDLLASCEARIPKAFSVGRIKPRDKLHIDEAILTEFQITISKRWVKAIEATHHPDIYGWGVFAFE